MAVTYLADALAALISVGIIVIGARFLLAPQASAVGFGVPAAPRDAYLAVKAVRDIASGLFIGILLIAGAAHLLGWVMLAGAVIPLGDALIVLRHKGSKALAYAMHGGTAAMMLVIAALLLSR
jgi:hypothetical protein